MDQREGRTREIALGVRPRRRLPDAPFAAKVIDEVFVSRECPTAVDRLVGSDEASRRRVEKRTACKAFTELLRERLGPAPLFAKVYRNSKASTR